MSTHSNECDFVCSVPMQNVVYNVTSIIYRHLSSPGYGSYHIRGLCSSSIVRESILQTCHSMRFNAKKIASSSISIIYSLSLRRTNTSVNIEINTDLCACFHNRKNSRTSTDARSVYEYIQHRKNRNKSGSGWTTQKKKQNSNKHE